MNLITTTQLRTKTKNLVDSLLNGNEITVVHRSRVIGKFIPQTGEEPKRFDAKKMAEIVKKLNLKPLSEKKQRENYDKHLREKYGKGLS